MWLLEGARQESCLVHAGAVRAYRLGTSCRWNWVWLEEGSSMKEGQGLRLYGRLFRERKENSSWGKEHPG